MEDKKIEKDDFSLVDAVDIFSRKAADIIALWNAYITATLLAVAVSYGLVQAGLPVLQDKVISGFVALGFVAFALGHAMLLDQTLDVREVIARDLRAVLPLVIRNPFHASLEMMVRTVDGVFLKARSRKVISFFIHLLIDGIVVASLLLPAFGETILRGRAG